MWRAAVRAVMKAAVTPGGDGTDEVGDGHVDQRGPLHVPAGDEVERHVEAAGLGGPGVRVLVDGLLVEGVDLGDLGLPASGGGVGGDRLEGVAGAPGQEDPGALTGEGAGHLAADRPAGPVDDGALALQ
jgi:hypothetical protein